MRKKNVFKQVVQEILVVVIFWFVTSLTIAGIVMLFADLPYRSVFIHVFLWGLLVLLVLDVILSITIQPWIKAYRKVISEGKIPGAAFKIACDNVKFKPPKFVLKSIVRFIK